ncbi:hypothetical protein Pan216_50610 [Planctomycetes bacterium Pan216]|uniref:Carboxypeptidase regulatory-like domain-containing protein n=1 Tax=Kolteria novifilia TaxID=2527975 RepID=A0A518BB12_9BACT|nr:hypothetical protein Pan216_50610 [Planctomycetes bacterium Pan216]
MNASIQRFQFVLGLILIGATIGCGGRSDRPETFPVKGTVTVNGTPLEKGTIKFRGDPSNTASTGGEVVDGVFAFDATSGEKLVEIVATRAIPGKFVEPNPGEKVQATEQFIPKEYNRESTLRADVQSEPPNEFTFDLKVP